MPSQNLSESRKEIIAHLTTRARDEYPSLWHDFCQEWRTWHGEDSLWLTYSANYLFNTAGVRWALDPFHLSARLPDVPTPDYVADLAGIQMVVFTHAHKDHLDMNLIKAMKNEPVKWVIPEFMQASVSKSVVLPPENIITPHNAEPIHCGGLTLTPFDGLHYNGSAGVPETGYLVEFDHTRWLFPGDVRNYNAAHLPLMPHLSGMVAHLWLGKGAASQESPPYLKAFAQFCMDMRPKQLIVTHLYELGRDEHDLWTVQHFNQVMPHLLTYFVPAKVKCALTGDRIPLK